jgi:hypothetical protein
MSGLMLVAVMGRNLGLRKDEKTGAMRVALKA